MIRIGSGFDVHGFDASRPLILGGVTIPDHPGLGGHSDADVVSHAVGDSLLGAVRLGDLGSLFPGTEKWQDASSLGILTEVVGLLTQRGFSIVNVDATVIAQRPRLAPHLETMARNIAAALQLAPERVSVKATSTDSLGFTGRGEGIAALAASLVEVTDSH